LKIIVAYPGYATILLLSELLCHSLKSTIFTFLIYVFGLWSLIFNFS